ncbi:hypothetical protein Ddc_17503 [Ditylenchus destructor]|nr:hypothetical protein Ddc_17503 [Ditylenchus destructor]
MNHNRIDFPLYTQLDIFKFLRAYDLQKSCINVSKEWRNTIRRYAGELPKFRDQKDRQAIERLLVGESEPEANQRRSEAYYQYVKCVIRKRNVRYFSAAATIVSVLILVTTSSILVLHNLHRDEDKSRILIFEQDQASRQVISNGDKSFGQSASDEILAMVALSWTTMFLTSYCVWLFDKNAPGQPYQLILYTSARVILLSIISCVKISDIAFTKWLIVLPLYSFELLFWIYLIMESKFDDENISLMNHNRIDFPLYTQLDIFKFLRAYDLQKSCINVSKEWRNTIRRYAGELPKFRDQRDRQAIERLIVGETVLEANQRISEAYYQRVEGVIRKRNARYFAASATVISLLILGIISSTLILHNLHRDEEKPSRISISEQDVSSKQVIPNEDNSSGHSISDEVLAMVALSWTTIYLTRYCVWLFDKKGPRKPYQLIVYALERVPLSKFRISSQDSIQA